MTWVPTLAEVETAEEAFERASARRARPKAPVLAEPGCDRACATCSLECSIIHGIAIDLRKRYGRGAHLALRHADLQYLEDVGRC